MGRKQIAILTGGGSTPRMNAAVRSAVRTALTSRMGALRIHRGYNGLLSCDAEEVSLRSASDIIRNGGTMFYIAHNPELNPPEGVQEAAESCRKLGTKGLIVIGGGGSFRSAYDLTRARVLCIGMSGTIDDNITCSKYTIGCGTAIDTVMQMVNHLRGTTESRNHCSVVKVMGQRCGDIMLNTGIAVSAMATSVPGQPYDFEHDIYQRIQYTRRVGKRHPIIVVMEGARCHMEELAKEIEKNTGIETRVAVPDHVQRGGSPSLHDHVIATQMGYHTVKLLEDGESNHVVAVQRGQIVDFDIIEALEVLRRSGMELYWITTKVSI